MNAFVNLVLFRLPLPTRIFRAVDSESVLRADGSFAEMDAYTKEGGLVMHGAWRLDDDILHREIACAELFGSWNDDDEDDDDVIESHVVFINGSSYAPGETKHYRKPKPMPGRVLSFSREQFVEERRLYGCRFGIRWTLDPSRSPTDLYPAPPPPESGGPASPMK